MKARGIGRRRKIAGYKAAWRVGRKARRRAVIREVAAQSAEWRTTVYRNQNRVWGARNTSGDGLTPRQRRRVTHKENAAR